MRWMLDIQLGRRNLTPIQKIAATEKYRPIYEKQARENQLSGLKNVVLTNLSKRDSSVNSAIDTTQELANIAGVSRTTYRMGAKILNSDDEELKQRVMSGETKISTGYKELQSKNKQKVDDVVEKFWKTVRRFTDASIWTHRRSSILLL